jgi:ELP3 family radical SAM enzyme/protein acetyltransferase
MTDLEDICSQKIKLEGETKLKKIVDTLINETKLSKSIEEIENISKNIHKRYNNIIIKNKIRYIFEKYFSNSNDNKDKIINPLLYKYLIKKSMRSRSGVLVSTIVLKPDVFSCPKKCSYCPTETDLKGNPTQPKSYLSSEPAMLRALEYNFDVKGQIHDRIKCYIQQGNIQSLDDQYSYKMEIILSGGTWESYPYEYRNQVMKEIYWACNTYKENTEIGMLEEEIKKNETSQFRVIGMTIETRPDFITKQSIKDYRRWGVTRVQIGVQHYDDSILDLIKRECYTLDTINSIKMLKECGFKIVCHLMPDLPGSSIEKDIWMFDQAIFNELLQFDDVKIYPTAICKSHDPSKYIVKSDISDWYNEGSYIPYAEKNLKDLINVLKYYKKNIQPWVRIQRLVRDIPKKSIEAGYDKMSNLRQVIQDEMKKEGTKCNCIRCFEIDDKIPSLPSLVVREYNASYGKEYFISIEDFEYLGLSYFFYILKYYIFNIFGYYSFWSGNNTRKSIIGFCRLRIDKNPGGDYIKELKGCGLIREVHVYGSSLCIKNISDNHRLNNQNNQHKGYGKLLVEVAEKIITNNGLQKSAVIAGVGTREYYKNKCGYKLEGTYMIKKIEKSYNLFFLMFIFFSVFLMFFRFF